MSNERKPQSQDCFRKSMHLSLLRENKFIGVLTYIDIFSNNMEHTGYIRVQKTNLLERDATNNSARLRVTLGPTATFIR